MNIFKLTMPYYLYVVSCPAYAEQNICKIGCTNNPHDRIRPYFTSYPPGLPQYDIRYYKLWEISVNNDEDMRAEEEKVHDEFAYQRLVRTEKSEWFHIENFLEMISQFIEKELNGNPVELPNIERKQRSPLETVVYKKNKKLFIRKEDQKNIKLNEIQQPVIEQLQNFLQNKEINAGQLIAPCGSGKTNMTCRAIQSLNKIIICVPTLIIQQQWFNRLEKECLFVGGVSDDWNSIIKKLNSDSYCIITTYASCKKLIDILPDNNGIIVFDEAHHMAGYVSNNNDEGEGITRALLDNIVNRNMKRLFLTFTPKDAFIEDENTKVFSMHDERIFGNIIAELKLRDLINQGILPDYRIWPLTSKGTGMLGKLEQVLSAWNSGEIHHLMIFVKEINDKEEVFQYLIKEGKLGSNEEVLIINEKNTKKTIEKFKNSNRAILIDCFRLGEGVDIPIADSVAILYPKGSVTSIIQTILRPGRWYKHKSVFHILLPHTADEDMKGIQNVLLALAQYDDALRGEVLLTSKTKTENNNIFQTSEVGNTSDIIVQYDVLSPTDVEKMKECFESIRTILTIKRTKKESYEFIKQLNKQLNIVSKNQYLESKLIHPKYIEDPKIYFREHWTCWYEFLGLDTSLFPKTKHEWIHRCKEREITTWEEYKNKKDITLPNNPSEIYEDYTNWNQEFEIHEEIIW